MPVGHTPDFPVRLPSSQQQLQLLASCLLARRPVILAMLASAGNLEAPKVKRALYRCVGNHWQQLHGCCLQIIPATCRACRAGASRLAPPAGVANSGVLAACGALTCQLVACQPSMGCPKCNPPARNLPHRCLPCLPSACLACPVLPLAQLPAATCWSMAASAGPHCLPLLPLPESKGQRASGGVLKRPLPRPPPPSTQRCCICECCGVSELSSVVC